MLLGFYNYLVFYCGMSVEIIKNDDDDDDDDDMATGETNCNKHITI